MPNNKIVIAELELDIDGLTEAAKDSQKAIAKVKEELLALKDAGKESTAQFANNRDELQKLTQALQTQLAALTEQVQRTEDLANAQKEAGTAAQKALQTQNELAAGYSASADTLQELETTAQDAAQTLSTLNSALQQNESLMGQGEGSTAKSAKTFNDYKTQVKESFDSINLFNGGLGGLISRAQEAGGVGPLVAGAFNGMATGIGGMTKASLAFIATPMGLILTGIAVALKAVISYFTDTQEGVDKLTAITRPLQSVFQALMGVFQNVGKYLADMFTNPKQALIDFANLIKENLINQITGLAELIPNLGKAIGQLFSGDFSDAAKTATDAIAKVALGTENITDKIAGAANETGKFLSDAYERGKQIDELQKSLDRGLAGYTERNSELSIELDKQNAIADDTNATFAQRETAVRKAIETIKEQNKLVEERMDDEIKLLALKQKDNGISAAEKAEMAEMVAKQKETAAQHIDTEKAMYSKLDSIRQEAYDKEKDRRQKAIDDAITKQKQLLDLFTAEGDTRQKTLKEALDYEDTKSAKALEILKAELNAKKINQLQFDAQSKNLNAQTAEKKLQLAASYSRSELELWKAENQSKIASGKNFTDEMMKQEGIRLETLKKKQIEQLQLETGLTEQKDRDALEAKRKNHQELNQEEMEYLTELQNINNDFRAQGEAIQNAKKDRDANQKALEYETALTEDITQYEKQKLLEEQRYENEKTELEARKTSDLANAALYDTLLENNEKEHTGNLKKINQDLADYKLSLQSRLMGEMATILGKENKAGKAFAIAQATIDTYQSAVAAYRSQLTMDPTSPVRAAIAAAAAVATGLKNVQKIAGVKDPKFEQGGLMAVGGNRHTNGGTLFTGSDGTRFEAEQGELIGIMNRNAAHHFMAFNNAFPAGGTQAPNYFANGGIVSREIAQQNLNLDELAAKIALANRALPAPVVAVEDIINRGNSYIKVKEGANF